MKLVNETGQQVYFWIQTGTTADCGTIDVNGLVDLPQDHDQTDVYVGFNTVAPQQAFSITCANTRKGEQVEMALVVQ